MRATDKVSNPRDLLTHITGKKAMETRHDLAMAYGMSIEAAGFWIKALEWRGMIVKIPGRGTTVTIHLTDKAHSEMAKQQTTMFPCDVQWICLGQSFRIHKATEKQHDIDAKREASQSANEIIDPAIDDETIPAIEDNETITTNDHDDKPETTVDLWDPRLLKPTIYIEQPLDMDDPIDKDDYEPASQWVYRVREVDEYTFS